MWGFRLLRDTARGGGKSRCIGLLSVPEGGERNDWWRGKRGGVRSRGTPLREEGGKKGKVIVICVEHVRRAALGRGGEFRLRREGKKRK